MPRSSVLAVLFLATALGGPALAGDPAPAAVPRGLAVRDFRGLRWNGRVAHLSWAHLSGQEAMQMQSASLSSLREYGSITP